MKIRRSLAATAVALALFGLGACGAPDRNAAPSPTVEQVAAAPSTPTTTPAPTTTHDVARLTKVTTVYAEPSAQAPVVTTLEPTTVLGSTTSLLVLDEQHGWLDVSLPTRPNGSTGWIEATDAEVRSNDFAVTVDLAAHHLTVTKGDQVALTTPVAVGADDTPTPTGSFYVTDLVNTSNPSGVYGPFALGLSGHSDVLDQFGGGDGQIGLHGTNDPSSIGRSVSHGCVRVPNEVITQLANVLPLGTPVTIV